MNINEVIKASHLKYNDEMEQEALNLCVKSLIKSFYGIECIVSKTSKSKDDTITICIFKPLLDKILKRYATDDNISSGKCRVYTTDVNGNIKHNNTETYINIYINMDDSKSLDDIRSILSASGQYGYLELYSSEINIRFKRNHYNIVESRTSMSKITCFKKIEIVMDTHEPSYDYIETATFRGHLQMDVKLARSNKEVYIVDNDGNKYTNETNPRLFKIIILSNIFPYISYDDFGKVIVSKNIDYNNTFLSDTTGNSSVDYEEICRKLGENHKNFGDNKIKIIG